ncbi:MAG: helix-turn-helix domain-containing protein [Actinomycetota bacterium]|nr:helix-turn-helix domain-containing protein [Actinomycetota bacterium]
MLTVEEAAALLRIGRTKAYAMAKEWRDTGDKSGLPVVDFGGVLRVPLAQLEEMVGGPLFTGDLELLSILVESKRPAGRSSGQKSPAPAKTPTGLASIDSRRPRRSRRSAESQLDLFDSASSSGR